MKNIGLFVKRGAPEAGKTAAEAILWLNERGFKPLYSHELNDGYGISGGVSFEEVVKQSELLLILGGDGTFLAGAREAYDRRIPILGVNLGGLGFLTNTTTAEMFDMLNLIFEEKAEFESLALLDVTKNCKGISTKHRVLNDVVLAKTALARIIEIRVTTDDMSITKMLADGIIVSTPTGSTAYSMSAGGPICHTSVDAIILTPICPHLLANRPLLVPDSTTLRIELISGDESYITMDGQIGGEFRQGDWFEVGRSKYSLKLVKNPNRTYYQTLRDKLRWGER